MKVLATAAALLFAASASGNPFAPQVTKNTAKANYIGALMRGAKPTENSQLRRLEEEAQVDITSYSLKFEKCQFVKQYNGGQGNNKNNKNGADTILATKRFVVFRLCPNSSCSSCNYNYGEYIVDMDTYLQATLKYKQEEQENNCIACEECGNDDAAAAEEEAAAEEAAEDGGRRLVNCNTCYDECLNIQNMEENGYVDAAEYTQCQKIYENDNSGKVYYAGAMCSSSGTRIKIGLFEDDACSIYDSSAEIDQYLKNNNGYNVKLSYHLLKQIFPESDCVASCADANNVDGNGNAQVAEVCGDLYYAAGKCESAHGFESGIASNDNYANQVAQEELVCDFISTVAAGSYDQSGEIVLSGGRQTVTGLSRPTGGQKFALTFFILGTVGLAGYAAMLHHNLTKRSKADLSGQGGALA